MRYLAALLLLITPTGMVRAQAPPAACGDSAAPLLILGTYHMGNPGLDATRLEADDVLSPRRQTEIAAVLDRLAAFRPTRIGIESGFTDPTWPERYRLYLTGDYRLGGNEIEQIGFRLARRLGHSAVYPVDFPMFMNGASYAELDLALRRAETREPTRRRSDADSLTPAERRLRGSTVLEYLRWLNHPDQVARSHQTYLRMLRPDREVSLYRKTDLVTNWYKRNLRIFTNLARITDFTGEDRVLLLIGAGHLAILRQLAADAPYFCLADVDAALR